jgi:hypothetical protein
MLARMARRGVAWTEMARLYPSSLHSILRLVRWGVAIAIDVAIAMGRPLLFHDFFSGCMRGHGLEWDGMGWDFISQYDMAWDSIGWHDME